MGNQPFYRDFTAGPGPLFALLCDLSEIATITSTVFTVIYILVLFSHLRIHKQFGGNKILILFHLLILLVVSIAFTIIPILWFIKYTK